jgi:hypothetical protein
VKCRTRQLECIYRDKKSEPDRVAWHAQTRHQHFIINEKYVLYWSVVIKNNTGDPKALWSKVSALLKAPTGASSSVSTHTADDFTAYFKNKVDVIRSATSSAPPLGIEARPCSVLSGMTMVTTAEITKIVSCSPAKHCSLAPASTWLVKCALPLLANTIASMCNASMSEGIFSGVLKHAIVQPRLKKQTLDPAELCSYHPISNLSFISKTVERVVTACFSEHVETERLLPSHPSAYQAHHSTETAITAVHDELVHNIDSGFSFCLIRSTNIHNWKFLVSDLVSREQFWTGLILTLRIKHSHFSKMCSDMSPTEFTARYHKVWFSVPRSLLLILKIWMTISTVTIRVATTTLMNAAH